MLERNRDFSFRAAAFPPVTELPTTPFPELRALEARRRVPSLTDLLQGAPSLPSGPPTPPATSEGPALELPDLPVAGPEPDGHPGGPTPSFSVPVPASLPEHLADLMSDEEEEPSGDDASNDQQDFALPPAGDSLRQEEPPEQPPTDEDLAEALQPILQTTLEKALGGPGKGLHAHLEPMLRSTVRRAMAEQLEISGMFRETGTADRLMWRLRAFFTSRTYDEVVFERTRRYQVEEVYLLRPRDGGLVSYAVHDPAVHASTQRVRPHLRRLTSRLRREGGKLQPSIDLPEHRVALVREGVHTLLVAVVRGRSNALVRADLDYVHRQIEDEYGSALESRSNAYLQALQPILEGCLLIQSPAAPH